MVPAIDPVDSASDPHIVLGLVGAPGAAFSLARELADAGLDSDLDERLPAANPSLRSRIWKPYVFGFARLLEAGRFS